MIIQAVRGTKDILPYEIQYQRLIVEKARKILESANYLEICTPIIENTNLFVRSIGQDTDIINKEMYSFQDQGKREITLRPEGTAGVTRAFIENKLHTQNNISRFWYFGPMFRYERPQAGRQRQFYQLGIECFGTTDPRSDAEVIYLATNLLTQLKCTKFSLEINSIGDLHHRIQYQNALRNYLLPYINELDENSKNRLYTNPFRILDSKNLQTREILAKAPILYDFLDDYSKQHFESVCNNLNILNIPYAVNNQLVRGLDYYNNTAFEIQIKLQDIPITVCGGGRYDGLVEQLGGPNMPAIGWAIGIERLQQVIKNKFQFFNQNIDIYIASQGEAANQYSLKIMKFLQEKKFTTVLDFSNKSFTKQLTKANKASATACLLIGDQEMLDQVITIKWLHNGEQEILKQEELDTTVSYLKHKIQNINTSLIP